MALIMSKEAQIKIFEQIFGPESDAYQAVKNLSIAGVTFETGLYTVKATYQGKVYQKTLMVGITALAKKNYGVPTVNQAQIDILKAWVKSLVTGVLESQLTKVKDPEPDHAKVLPEKPNVEHGFSVHLTGPIKSENTIAVIKLIREIMVLGLKEAKEIVDQIKSGENKEIVFGIKEEYAEFLRDQFHKAGCPAIIVEEGVPPVDPIFSLENYLKTSLGSPLQPIAQINPASFKQSVIEKIKNLGIKTQNLSFHEVDLPSSTIPLREAKAIGQKVRGTSANSTYYCVALNDKIKIATRIYPNGTVSIRAEWNGGLTDTEMGKLQQAGMSMKPGYGSMHLDAPGVPPGRIVGGFLIGLGLHFDQILVDGSKLVVEGANV